MPARVNTTAPSFMAEEPKPLLENRRFHNYNITVWVGDVAIDDIEGWIGNPRTELKAGQFNSRYGRQPTSEEMYQMVLGDDDPKEGLKIRELAGNIYKNGVRVPIVLTYDRRLLDGNRRFYACTFLSQEGAPKHERQRFKTIPALVLPEGTKKEIENAIITEFNFASDYREEWPYYVKAMKVYEDYSEKNLDKDDLVQKYSVDWKYLSKWIQAANLCDRFLDSHGYAFIAQQFAYRNFIMFDEMMRNYGKRFSQTDFRDAVFKLLIADYPDNPRFTKSSDVVRLDEIWDNTEAWEVLVTKKGPPALKEALTILDLTALDNLPDPNPKLRRVVGGLDKLLRSGSLNAADTGLLEQLHRHIEQVPGAPSNPSAQVGKMIEWLDAMTSRQIAELESETLDKLREALDRVLRMAEAVSDIGLSRNLTP